MNRPKPKTRFGIYLRRSERVFVILAVLYAVLHIFPQTVFAHSVTANGITIYSRSPLPPEATLCAARAAELVKQSELACAERHAHIFVCDRPWLFRLFSPRSPGAFAVSVPLTDNMFVAAADFYADVAMRSGPDFNKRSFSSVMAHEITHGLIRHRLGLVSSIRLPDWVAEGYCDYVACESSFPEEDGLRLFASGQKHPSMSYRYFTYRQMVRYLAEHQNLNFSEIVARANEPDAVATEARQALQSGIPQ
jgi:hypothetical protein